MGVHYFEALGTFYPDKPKSAQYWDELFAKTVTAHFFNHMVKHRQVMDDPKYFAYSYLGRNNYHRIETRFINIPILIFR